MKTPSVGRLALLVLLTVGSTVREPRLVVLPAPRAALAAMNGDHEQFVCLQGTSLGSLVFVTGVTSVTIRGRLGSTWATEVTCEGPWIVGLAHNHPVTQAIDDDRAVNPETRDPRRCWFRFPGTVFGTADLESFRASGLPVSVIVCGDRLVWEGR